MKRSLFVVIFFCVLQSAIAQADSVDVTFRYTPPPGVTQPYLTGEFNGWVNNAWPMTHIGGNVWIRTVRLRIGGNPNPPPVGIRGAWQYKFWYAGVTDWPNDPLNHHVNPADHNNSYIYTRDPTIYHLLPNQRQPTVATATPTISAYLFPKVGGSVDTGTISVNVDGEIYTGLGAYYNPSTKYFSFPLPRPLSNGQYTVILAAGNSRDTVTFFVRAGYVQILNVGPVATWKASRTIYGSIVDTTIRSAWIIRNGRDTIRVPVSRGKFNLTVGLVEGVNTFVAEADSATSVARSGPFVVTRLVDHRPKAKITFADSRGSIFLSARESTDPDSGQTSLLTFLWSADPTNPEPLGIDGSMLPYIALNKPKTPGEYFFGLIATDPDGNRDTTRNYFTLIHPDSAIQPATYASVPSWVKQGRVYELFFKAFTPQGTINAAIPRLPHLRDLGFNIIWVMPVMKNLVIDHGSGTGYNIVDFYTVTPQYGTNQDFKNFVRECHRLGMKVILDVTPNHTGSSHPFAIHARQFREYSPYWDFYEHSLITSNTNNLGDCLTLDGFNYYCGFSDQLLNYNWADIDARTYMTEVYKYWIKEFNIDGYRLDVYWGPRRRYGEHVVGAPLREALRHIKPDIFLLAEDDGTGFGTEVIYADRGGGADSGYDWNLYWNGIVNFWTPPAPRISSLNSQLLNGGSTSMGFVPGPNSYFFRFMENHDEDRMAYVYKSFEKTMPVATTLFTSVGIPLLYQGQEVGWGLGIPDFDRRRRGVIDWNFAGRSLLMPHYQKLAHIRRQFAPFWTQEMVRTVSGNEKVYAFTRPYPDLNGIVVVNFDSVRQNATVILQASGSSRNVIFRDGVRLGVPYFASDLYNDTVYTVTFTGSSTALALTLPPYGSRVFVLADRPHRLELPPITSVERTTAGLPQEWRLYQNYPNPFNPTTTITYSVPSTRYVSLKIYDVLGREVASLVDETTRPGTYTVTWDARGVASGVYFYRLKAGGFVETKKAVLLR